MLEGEDDAVRAWLESLTDADQGAENYQAILEDDNLKLLPIWELLVQDEYADRRIQLEEYFNEHLDEDFADYYSRYVYSIAGQTDYSDYTFVQTAEDFKAIRNNLDGKYVLLNNIDLGGAEWTPFGTEQSPFTGVLDGNGYNINNVNINGNNYVGLFGKLKLAEIKKIDMQDLASQVMKNAKTLFYKLN